MQLPAFLRNSIGARAYHPGLKAALVAAAAVAGYVSFLPAAPKSDSIQTQPQWAGHIERAELDPPAPAAPVTSASYAATDLAVANSAAKKAAIAAVAPKPTAKLVLPPRRPEEDARVIAASPASAETAAIVPVSTRGDLIPPASIPTAAHPAAGTAKAEARNLLSPVTDRLPSTGSLLKPFNVVGDAIHNWVKF